jgi:hypothetical protein
VVGLVGDGVWWLGGSRRSLFTFALAHSLSVPQPLLSFCSCAPSSSLLLGIEYAKGGGVYEVEAERWWCETEKPIRITRD